MNIVIEADLAHDHRHGMTPIPVFQSTAPGARLRPRGQPVDPLSTPSSLSRRAGGRGGLSGRHQGETEVGQLHIHTHAPSLLG